MFCEKCGKQIADDSAFCDGCGAKVESIETPQAQPVAEAAPVSAPAEKKPFVLTKKHKIIGLAGVGVILLAIIIAIIVSIASKNVNLKKYINVVSAGYNGYGSVDYDIDYDALYEKITGEEISKYKDIEDISSLENAAQIVGNYYTIYGAVSVEVTYPQDKSSSKLSNGDVVTLTVSFDEAAAKKLGIKAKTVTIEHKIENLGEASTFDVLSNFEVEFTGYDGVGSAKIVPKDITKTVGSITFDIAAEDGAKVSYESTKDEYTYGSYWIEFKEYYYNLSNGDTIEVYVSGAEEGSLRTSGVILEGLTKKITVEGLEETASYDVLSNFTVDFTGVNGDGDAKIAAKDSSTKVGEVTFTTSADEPRYLRWSVEGSSSDKGSFYISFDYSTKTYDLSTGDKVTIECDYSADYLIEHGVMLTGLTKEFEVKGLGEYATKLADISAETLATIAADCKESLMNRLYDDWGDTVHNSWRTYKNQVIGDDMAVYKTIMTTPKNTGSSSYSNLFIIFSVTLQDDSMDAATKYYFYYDIEDIVITADGKAEYDMKYGVDKSEGYTDYNEIYEDEISSFNVNIEIGA